MKPKFTTVFIWATLVCYAISANAKGNNIFDQSFNIKADSLPANSFYDNFNSGNASRWDEKSGIWTVSNGKYIGEGTGNAFCQAGPSSIYETLIRQYIARDVVAEVDMKSIERVDKIIILRSADSGSQIELNFRANPFGDLIVQERVNCEGFIYTPEFSVPIPHQVGQTIHVRLKLIGQKLSVWIDDVLVLDRTFNFKNTKAGQGGVAVIDAGKAEFDNVKAIKLDNLKNTPDNLIVTNSSRKIDNKLTIFPNPVHSIVNATYLSNSSGYVQLIVLDKTGKAMFAKVEHAIKGKNTFQLDLSHLINGIYNLQLINGAAHSQAKFVIQK